MKTNTPHWNNPPRPSSHVPGTEQWDVRLGTTSIWFSRDRSGPPDVTIERVLTEEDLDVLRLAFMAGVPLTESLLIDPAWKERRLAYYRDRASAAWHESVASTQN